MERHSRPEQFGAIMVPAEGKCDIEKNSSFTIALNKFITDKSQ
jgi:hypothetical protein